MGRIFQLRLLLVLILNATMLPGVVLWIASVCVAGLSASTVHADHQQHNAIRSARVSCASVSQSHAVRRLTHGRRSAPSARTAHAPC